MEGVRAVGFDLDGTFMRTRVDYDLSLIHI